MWFRFLSGKSTSPDILEGKLRQSDRVLTTAQGDAVVLLDLNAERYFTLNDVGSRAWALLGDGATKEEIAVAIRREFVVPSPATGDSVGQDIAQLITELYVAGLIVPDHTWARGA
ncbi:MAG: hypothetical protein JWM95_4863 [Gemmatimonadetes bacterium]|nr:hypothetical protein [Gemmatimonadota bacterium]